MRCRRNERGLSGLKAPHLQSGFNTNFLALGRSLSRRVWQLSPNCGALPRVECGSDAMAAQAKVLSGSKLEQLVVRLQRHSGRPKEACWRFIIQHGIKGQQDHRRWTETEFEIVREELVKRSIEEVARKVNRTPKAIRNMLNRNDLNLREIRCDLFQWRALQVPSGSEKQRLFFGLNGLAPGIHCMPRQAEIIHNHA